ncbi:MAG: ribonuclease HI family protein [Deltaproteobacteria bacterium]|nr:MAG: ribonuclease HI family protein [Deltaproteobacteria bacterium]
MPEKSVLIYIDGASRGNPGESGAAAILKDGSGKVLGKTSKYLGEATNNVAEYQALLLGLKEAKKLGAKKISIYSDSELLIKQMEGEYRVKSESLKDLFRKAIKELKKFPQTAFSHIPRENNKEADKLANRAIDEG